MGLAAVSEDIKALLQANAATIGISGIAVTSFEWRRNSGGTELDKQIIVRDLDAIEALNKTSYEQPVFQILVRGDSREGYKTVHDRARDIYEFLLQQPRQTPGAVEYVQYAPFAGGLTPLPRDDNNRVVYAMTFFTYRDPL